MTLCSSPQPPPQPHGPAAPGRLPRCLPLALSTPPQRPTITTTTYAPCPLPYAPQAKVARSWRSKSSAPQCTYRICLPDRSRCLTFHYDTNARRDIYAQVRARVCVCVRACRVRWGTV